MEVMKNGWILSGYMLKSEVVDFNHQLDAEYERKELTMTLAFPRVMLVKGYLNECLVKVILHTMGHLTRCGHSFVYHNWVGSVYCRNLVGPSQGCCQTS